MSNRFSRLVAKVYKLPKFSHSWLLTRSFCSQVKYANTSNIKINAIGPSHVSASLANKKAVQNHIGGVHAIAAALLAESATGIAFAMHLPDSRLPLLKSMAINYQRRMQGNLNAIATVSSEQIATLAREEKGSMVIAVTITDESSQQPIECLMEWAWVAKTRKS